MKEYCVYMHVSPSGKRYIGITSQNPTHRWNNGKGYADNKHFKNAIDKYGWENFEHLILYSGLTQNEACQKERELIKLYNSANQNYGYNLTTGGESFEFSDSVIERLKKPKKLTPEGCEKLRLNGYAAYERNLKNTPITPERIKKMADSKRGKKQTEEVIQKRTEALKMHWKENGGFSDEHKRKISEKLKGRTYSPEVIEKFRRAKTPDKNGRSKRVDKIGLDGSVICTYNSVREAGRENSIDYTSIVRVCNGKLKHAGGFDWRYSA